MVVTLSFGPLAALGLLEKPSSPVHPGAEYSGMYSFLREGEFVQITVEDAGRVSGFVARYGDLDSDKGILLDHFFSNARLDGGRLSFETEVVHGISYEFQGTFGRGVGKKPGDEGQYVIEGKLTEANIDDSGKQSRRDRGVALRSLAHSAEGKAPTPVPGK
jgi:hypothetical protein